MKMKMKKKNEMTENEEEKNNKSEETRVYQDTVNVNLERGEERTHLSLSRVL